MTAHLSDAELLARLVAFDTASRNSNLPLAGFLAEYLDRPGIRVERNFSADGTKANLIAWLGPEPQGDRRGLMRAPLALVFTYDEEVGTPGA